MFHYNGKKNLKVEPWHVCAAFPEGIPKKIIFGKHDHTKPFRGDHGIQYEAIDEE